MDDFEIANIIKDIADNREVVITCAPVTGYLDYDENEQRYCLKIIGPERLVKKLENILWEVE